MKTMRLLLVMTGVILSVSCMFLGGRSVAAPAPSAREQMVGTWKLVSRVVKHADGSSNPDPYYGPKYPIGYIMYDRTGHMAVQFMGLDRPKNNSSLAYEAYFGTYTVNDQTKPPTVTHHMEGNLKPASVGMDVVRDLLIDGDKLTLVVHTETTDMNINNFVRVK